MMKETAPEELATAVRQAYAGGKYVSRSVECNLSVSKADDNKSGV